MPLHPKNLLASLALLLLCSCGPDLPEGVEEAYAALPSELDYNIHVRPILSDRCYACHGPDKANQKGGLHMDTPEGSYAESSEHPGHFAIVPGDPESSEAIARILHDDPALVMPPPESNLTLSDYEKAVLVKWVEQGAQYKPHWAFIPPEEHPVPETEHAAWTKNPIDNFIAARLERDDLEPKEQADPAILLRRLTLDLTGLPPEPEHVKDFVADPSNENYERHVDRLLASPHYGEHLAVDWMDLARYADSHGYTVDRFRDMSPWRDWVIKSFNENMRYDSFVVWQLAGDLLPNATTEQILATGFNRNHSQNMEGGIVGEEYRVEYVADRANTFGTAFLGLTVACAKCHDHKYDPISQEEYYETFAFFNNIDEAGQISWNDAMPVPTLTLPNSRLDSIREHLGQQMARTQEQSGKTAADDRAAFDRWRRSARAPGELPAGLTARYSLNNNLRNSRGGPAGEMRRQASNDERPTFTAGHAGRGLQLDGDAWLHCTGTGVFDRADEFTVGLWVKLPADLRDGVIFHKGHGAALHNFRGYHLALKDNRLEILLAHTAPYNAIRETSLADLPRDEWIHLALSYDGSSQASGLRAWLNGEEVATEVNTDNLYKDILFTGMDEEPPLQIGARWRGKGIGKATVDEITVFDRELTALEVNQVAGGDRLRTQLATRDGQASEDLFAYYRANHDADYRRARAELRQLRKEEAAAAEQLQEVMVMDEMDEPRPAYILERGLYDQHGKPVTPGVIEAVAPWDDALPQNRLGLATWLIRDDNPLFGRTAVNRFWQHYFGTGLVKTSEDFGSQGDRPTHPELLDWLTIRFRESGYDMKALQRLIVTSATYRQSSMPATRDLEIDKANQLLARGPSARLTAEELRDNALAAAGLLKRQIGGPSVNPYQPDGLYRMNGSEYFQHHGDSLYRRGLYTVWKRTVPNPTQATFDAPMRSECTVRRQRTMTPLQSLVLLNDPTFVEASRKIGERIARTENPQLAIGTEFLRLTGRQATERELALLIDLRDREYQKFHSNREKMAGWLAAGESARDTDLEPALVAANSVVASTIINMDATIIKR